jgi:hypothetical protein
MKLTLLASAALAILCAWSAPLLASCDLAASALASSYCPCDGGGTPWRNHGLYVACVQSNAASIARSGGSEVSCRSALTACAARSVCGRPGAVVCLRGGKCSVANSADRCTSKGGTVSTANSCCELGT